MQIPEQELTNELLELEQECIAEEASEKKTVGE